MRITWREVRNAIFCMAFSNCPLGWVHTRNVTAYRNTVSWQCGRDSWPRNVSKIGYSVTLRACSVCCRYLAVASKGWYGYGLSRCGRATCHVARPHLESYRLWCVIVCDLETSRMDAPYVYDISSLRVKNSSYVCTTIGVRLTGCHLQCKHVANWIRLNRIIWSCCKSIVC